MDNSKISLNTKLEVAIEILSAKIAKTSREGYTTDDEEMKKLLSEREELYSGNEKILDKIIKIYGPEIKNAIS